MILFDELMAGVVKWLARQTLKKDADIKGQDVGQDAEKERLFASDGINTKCRRMAWYAVRDL